MLELLSDNPAVFAPVMRHDYLLGQDGLPVVPNFVQRFTNAVPTGQAEREVYLPYRGLHLPVFDALRILREGRGTREAKVAVVDVREASRPDPVPLPYPLSGGTVRSMELFYHVLEP